MSISIDTTVYVEVDEVIDEISTEDLIEELRKRENGKRTPGAWPLEEFAIDMRDYLLRGRIQGALALLEQFAYPKVDRLERAYREIQNKRLSS